MTYPNGIAALPSAPAVWPPRRCDIATGAKACSLTMTGMLLMCGDGASATTRYDVRQCISCGGMVANAADVRVATTGNTKY